MQRVVICSWLWCL